MNAIPIQQGSRPRRNTVQRSPVDHEKSLESIQLFLQSKDCLSILTVSSKMIVFDTRLQVIKALNALVQNGEHYLFLFVFMFVFTFIDRRCVSSSLVISGKSICWNVDHIRFSSFNAVLLFNN